MGRFRLAKSSMAISSLINNSSPSKLDIIRANSRKNLRAATTFISLVRHSSQRAGIGCMFKGCSFSASSSSLGVPFVRVGCAEDPLFCFFCGAAVSYESKIDDDIGSSGC